MKVGFHAPLPPVRSGVADYAARLLVELRKRGRVESGAESADVQLYHLGNNQLHRSIYEKAIADPGVIVLHDAVLQHFYLGAFDEARYVEEFVYNYGEWERFAAVGLYRERAASGMDQRYFSKPMLKRVATTAKAVIVHNAAAGKLVREHAPEAQIIRIPHFFHQPYPEERSLRAAWHAEETNVIFGVFGFLRESKRILPILQTFSEIYRVRPQARLLLAGQFASSDLARAVESWLKHPGVIRCGHLEERENSGKRRAQWIAV